MDGKNGKTAPKTDKKDEASSSSSGRGARTTGGGGTPRTQYNFGGYNPSPSSRQSTDPRKIISNGKGVGGASPAATSPPSALSPTGLGTALPSSPLMSPPPIQSPNQEVFHTSVDNGGDEPAVADDVTQTSENGETPKESKGGDTVVLTGDSAAYKKEDDTPFLSNLISSVSSKAAVDLNPSPKPSEVVNGETHTPSVLNGPETKTEDEVKEEKTEEEEKEEKTEEETVGEKAGDGVNLNTESPASVQQVNSGPPQVKVVPTGGAAGSIDYEMDALKAALASIDQSKKSYLRADLNEEEEKSSNLPKPLLIAVQEEQITEDIRKTQSVMRTISFQSPRATDTLWQLTPHQLADLAVNWEERLTCDISLYSPNAYPLLAAKSTFLMANGMGNCIKYLQALFDSYTTSLDRKRIRNTLTEIDDARLAREEQEEITRMEEERLLVEAKKKAEAATDLTPDANSDAPIPLTLQQDEKEASDPEPAKTYGGLEGEESSLYATFVRGGSYYEPDFDKIFAPYESAMKGEVVEEVEKMLPFYADSAPIEKTVRDVLILNQAVDALLRHVPPLISEEKAAGFKKLIEHKQIKTIEDLQIHFEVWRVNDPSIRISADLNEYRRTSEALQAEMSSTLNTLVNDLDATRQQLASMSNERAQYQAALRVVLRQTQVFQGADRVWGPISEGSISKLVNVDPVQLATKLDVSPRSVEEYAYTEAVVELVMSLPK